jgi:hypothetical protein
VVLFADVTRIDRINIASNPYQRISVYDISHPPLVGPTAY